MTHLFVFRGFLSLNRMNLTISGHFALPNSVIGVYSVFKLNALSETELTVLDLFIFLPWLGICSFYMSETLFIS